MDEKEIKRTTDSRKKAEWAKRTSKSGECGNFVRKGSRRR